MRDYNIALLISCIGITIAITIQVIVLIIQS